MSPPTQSKPLPLYKSFAASAIAACTAEVRHQQAGLHIETTIMQSMAPNL